MHSKVDLRGSFSLCSPLFHGSAASLRRGGFLPLHWSQLRRLSSVSIRAPGALLQPRFKSLTVIVVGTRLLLDQTLVISTKINDL